MRKLLLSSVVLSIFAISLTVFQMSCQKEATAQPAGSNYTLPAATTSTLGGVIVGNGLTVTGNGTLSVTSTSTGGLQQLGKILYEKYDEINNTAEFWTANYDGTNQTKIPIVLPNGLKLSEQYSLSPDGETLFFGVSSASGTYIYKCKLDGTGLTKIIDDSSPKMTYLGSAN